MFDELIRGREAYVSASNNGHFPDWNAANTFTSTLYGYPYAQSTQGYVAPQLDVTVNTAAYKHNAGDDTMEYETVNSKGKVKVKKLSNGFTIDNQVENYNDNGEIAFATITYSTKSYSGTAIIPGSDYTNGRYDKHFKHIIKLPGCSKAELNTLIGFKLKTSPCQKQKLFPHQGICEFENGVVSFAINPGFIKEVEKYISPSVLKRKPLVGFASAEQVIDIWRMTFCQHPVFCYLSNKYIMSLLMYFLNSAGIVIRNLDMLKPSKNQLGLTEEKLIAMLSTNNFHKYPVPTLESGVETIEREYSEVYDGIFLVKDQSFADEVCKIIDGVKAVIRCIHNNTGRCLPMIISQNAGYTAIKFASENAIIIDIEDVTVDYTAEEI